MKKRSLKIIVVLVVMLVMVPILVVSAESNAPVKCDLDITYDQHEPNNFYWLGKLSDCELEGEIKFVAVPEEYTYPGKTMHFVELFTINPYSGGEITGKNWGVWNLSTFKFRANGWVLDASPEWAHLIGAKYHEMGTTSPYYGNPEDLPILAPDGVARLVPAQRPSHALP